MILTKKFIVTVVVASTILSGCAKSECDKLYDQLKTFTDEVVATSQKLRDNPTDAELTAKYLKLVADIADLAKKETPCKDDNAFKAKIATLFMQASKNEVTPAQLDAAIRGQKATIQSTEQNQEPEKYVAPEQKKYKEVSKEEREANWAITGNYSGQFGEEDIIIEISYVSPDGTEIVGWNMVNGNKRELKGSVTGQTAHGDKMATLKEPGTDKYDGEFKIIMTEGGMNGEWNSYKGNASPKEFELVRHY